MYIAAKVKCIYGNVTDVLEGRQNILFTESWARLRLTITKTI